MPEPIYHVYANYCGERRLLFAGYASRVAKRFRFITNKIPTGVRFDSPFDCARDKFGNALPYTLWSGPIIFVEFVPTTEVVEYEGEIA